MWVLPAVMVAADAAKAEEPPINTDEECRECNGLGVTPCEQRAGVWEQAGSGAGRGAGHASMD